MVLATGYIIAIFGEIAIFSVMVFLFCFIRRGSGIGLVGTSMRAATSPNSYGIPTTMICPQGMVENITTLLVSR